MRRLLLLLAPALIATVLVVGAPATAAAPSPCGAWSGGAAGHEPLSAGAKRHIAAAKRNSDAVFEGQVALPKHARGGRPLHLNVQVVAVWKGDVTAPSRAKVVFQPGKCRDWALANPSPEDYLFFVNRQGDAWVAAGAAPRVVGHSDGLTAALGQPLQQPTHPQQTPVTFQRADTAAPRSFTKVAAPGAALIILGVFGLLVVRRLGRRA
jgi:hypothetical protein